MHLLDPVNLYLRSLVPALLVQAMTRSEVLRQSASDFLPGGAVRGVEGPRGGGPGGGARGVGLDGSWWSSCASLCAEAMQKAQVPCAYGEKSGWMPPGRVMLLPPELHGLLRTADLEAAALAVAEAGGRSECAYWFGDGMMEFGETEWVATVGAAAAERLGCVVMTSEHCE